MLVFNKKPWITKGILQSMSKRDTFYKDFATEKNAIKKNKLGAIYKTYRNLIVTLIRKSKKRYYADFFEEHQQNLKNLGWNPWSHKCLKKILYKHKQNNPQKRNHHWQ